MSLRKLAPSLVLVSLLALPRLLSAQAVSDTDADAVRVTVAMNDDGSHTTYQYDVANHKAVATTTSEDGKERGKILYTLDDQKRFASGEVFGADGKLRFKTSYKYDTATGRLASETQLDKNGEVMRKLVYSYDEKGNQSGYAVYDAAGKLIGQTTPKSPFAGAAPAATAKDAKPRSARRP